MVIIPGFGEIPILYHESTHKELSSKLKQIYEKLEDLSQQEPNPATLEEIVDLVKELECLCKNGLTINGQTHYLTTKLATHVSLVMQTLAGREITPDIDLGALDDQAKMDLVKDWQELNGLDQALINAIKFADPQKSSTLYRMIEMDLIKKGEQIIGGHLENLEEIMNLNNKVLNTLIPLQRYMNLIEPEPGGIQDMPNGGNWKDFIDKYKHWLGSNFEQILARVNITSEQAKELYSLFQDIGGVDGKGGLIKELEELGMSPTDPKSPAFALNEVYKSLKEVYDDVFKGQDPNSLPPEELNTLLLLSAQLWIGDNYNKMKQYVDAGELGQHYDKLSAAIKSFQTLNDENKQNINHALLKYEQYMKLASMLIDQINKSVETTTQKINTR